MTWSTADLKVGDSVYFQAQVRYMNSNTVQVTKVGRKWIELSNDCRVERGQTCADSRGAGSSQGQVWADEAAYCLWKTRSERFAKIRSYVRDSTWSMPKHLTDQDLDDLERIFRLNAEAS